MANQLFLYSDFSLFSNNEETYFIRIFRITVINVKITSTTIYDKIVSLTFSLINNILRFS